MPFVQQRHLTWLKLTLDARPTLRDSSCCASCRDLQQLGSNLAQNVSLLAETGFAEGQMCHALMRGTAEEKRNVAISTPMLVK